MLLLSGTQLRVLTADGRSSLRTVNLPVALNRVGERAKYYVGLTERSVVLIDKASTKVTREIPLPGEPASCLAVNPRSEFSYVVVHGAIPAHEDTVKDCQIAVIDEAHGAAKLADKAFGQCLAMDPQGHYLYACIYGTSLLGLAVDRWGGVWEIRQGSGALVAYSAQGPT